MAKIKFSNNVQLANASTETAINCANRLATFNGQSGGNYTPAQDCCLTTYANSVDLYINSVHMAYPSAPAAASFFPLRKGDYVNWGGTRYADASIGVRFWGYK